MKRHYETIHISRDLAALLQLSDEELQGLNMVAGVEPAPDTWAQRPAPGRVHGLSPRAWLQRQGYDARDTANYAALVDWMERRRRGQAQRGLCLIGNPGLGKSWGIELATRYTGSATRRIDAIELGARYAESPEAALVVGRGEWGSGWQTDIIIDDLGDEPLAGFHHGLRQNYVADILKLRYRLWQDRRAWRDGSPCLTHTTTNHSQAELERLYDARTISRLREMCEVCIFTGRDRRGKRTDATRVAS